MKKALISLTVCLTLLLSLAGFSVTVTADEYFSGSGTETDPFLISTAADLVQLATLTNTSDTGITYAVGKYYKLTADIDMSGVSAYMPISRAIGVGGSHTLPGGTTFKSTFDGDGHVIKNVTMTAQTLAAGGSTYGIIGWLGLDGVIKNLGVENIIADGGSTAITLCIGGIVGTIGGATAQPCAIQNCYVRGMTVTATGNGNQFVGGIVGRTVGQKGSIDNCYATGLSYTLTISNFAAGILGGCGNSEHTATNCYTTNSKLQGWATATNSYLTTTNCYASDTIASATPANLGSAFKADPNNKNNGYPLLAWESEEAAAGPVFSGSGTETDPYLIKTAADLTQLAALTNTADTAAEYAAAGMYYKLTDDIDMSSVAAYIPISRATSMYQAVATGGSFKGTLDGDGHIIKNVTMTSALDTYGNTYGIIGYLGPNGTVKNLGVENITIESVSADRVCIGGIAGSVSAPVSIDSCYVRGMTAASNGSSTQITYVGGIVGRTIGNAGSITNCYATGLSYTMVKDSWTAGIMGSCGNASYTAENCYTTHKKIQGNVSATDSYLATTNCYAQDELAGATPAALGSAFKADPNNKNNGYPLLAWESEEAEGGSVFSGSGTETDPYLIKTAADLTKLAALTNTADTAAEYAAAGMYYKLTDDIDMSSVAAYIPISRATNMYQAVATGGAFKGTLDGDGHIIKNVTMTAALDTYGNTYGIIGYVGPNGTVKNLGVENITVESVSADRVCIGGIAGSMGASVSIDNCYVRGMTAASNGSSAQITYVGGIVGRTIGNAGSITNCYATGLSYTMVKDSWTAGIMGSCGNANYTAENCYTTHKKIQGNVSATDSYLATTNCYAQDELAGATPAALGSAFKEDPNNKNNGYPLLAWENEEAEIILPLSFTEAAGILTANVKITNSSGAAKTFLLIIAEYNESDLNNMANVALKTIEVAAGASLTDTLTMSKTEGKSYEAFLWGQDTCAPVTAAQRLDF